MNRLDLVAVPVTARFGLVRGLLPMGIGDAPASQVARHPSSPGPQSAEIVA